MKKLSSNELRERYLEFFEAHGHRRIPSAPLIPENDPSVLFTTAGMHPLVPYLKGQPHPAGRRLTSVQKCLRTTDIEAVGDATHATVFEMLGNWSLGDYFKREAIMMSWEFLTSSAWLEIDPNLLAVSVFAGDADAPGDTEAATIWEKCGVSPQRIAHLDKKDNWWPAGGKALGPQGPDTEMFFWTGNEAAPVHFDPQDKRWVEIWNDVFMQYTRTANDRYETLPQPNVDTGMGLERVVMILQGLTSIYEIDTYQELVAAIAAAVSKPNERHQRIVADHLKAATFILADEHPVLPSKTGQGYVARRLIRRAVRSARVLGITNMTEVMDEGIHITTQQYGSTYPSLVRHETLAREKMKAEITQFEAVITTGLRHFDRLRQRNTRTISGTEAFHLYETYGFPIELTQELAREHQLTVDLPSFTQALAQHQTDSRQASRGKFSGGLADHSQESVHYHTATHLLHQALRVILGNHVTQRGSNITQERLRFDFSHPEKLSAEQLQRVEHMVNEKITADLPVIKEEMTVAEATAAGALGLFAHKYGERVSVYMIGDFSREICGGPHVTRTGELGRFRITREESAGGGIRRIKAVLE
ncbi:MAG: alanine--tRNA ligase [Candidatus Andersenbacteria bacterium]